MGHFHPIAYCIVYKEKTEDKKNLCREGDEMERMDEILNRMKYTTQDRQNIKTGIEVLDARTHLLCKGQLTLLGSRPGMGKKSVAIQIAQFVAQQGRRVVWISTSLSNRRQNRTGLRNAYCRAM